MQEVWPKNYLQLPVLRDENPMFYNLMFPHVTIWEPFFWSRHWPSPDGLKSRQASWRPTPPCAVRGGNSGGSMDYLRPWRFSCENENKNQPELDIRMMKHNFLEKERESIAASESWLLHLGDRSCWCLKLLSTYEQDVIDVGFHRRLGVPMKIRERTRVGHVLFVEYVGELPSKKLVVLLFSTNDCSGGPISTNDSWVLLDKPTAERYVHGWR